MSAESRGRQPDEEETIRQLLVEIRLLEGSIRIYQSRLGVIQAALSETLAADSTLEGIKGKGEGAEALIPIGGDSFIRAEIQDTSKIIMGVGAGVCMEKDIDVCIEDLKARRAEFEKASTALRQQLGQTLARLEQDKTLLSELLEKRSGRMPQAA